MFEMSIPKISDKELLKRYQQIKPVITLNGKMHYFKEFTLDDLRNTNFLCVNDENVREYVGEEVDKDELEALKDSDFVCLHTYDFRPYFVPTIGEVLAQIELKASVRSIKAFEIIDYPTTILSIAKDSFTSIAFKNGYHVSTVRLYVAKR